MSVNRKVKKNKLLSNYKYVPDIYWENTSDSYPHYPTVRHRQRFITNCIKKYLDEQVRQQGLDIEDFFVFDYGSGLGELLCKIQNEFQLNAHQLGGCDVSKKATENAKKKIPSPYIYNKKIVQLEKKCNVIICCEIFEHTEKYIDILNWIKNNLTDDGILILTTQAGKIHASDKYTGHKQHFKIAKLKSILRQTGYNIKYSALWGFPFFTLQKYLTDFNFQNIKGTYLEGKFSIRKKIIFRIAYLLYFIHDFIKFGPQIYIVAEKDREL